MPVSSLSFSNVAAGFRRYTAVLHGQLHDEYGREIPPPEQIVGKTRTALRLSKISGPHFSGFIQNQLYPAAGPPDKYPAPPDLNRKIDTPASNSRQNHH